MSIFSEKPSSVEMTPNQAAFVISSRMWKEDAQDRAIRREKMDGLKFNSRGKRAKTKKYNGVII